MAIYVLRSGPSCKVGVTESIDQRLAAYATHNPDFEVIRIFECDKSASRAVELAIKRELRNRRVGSSSEWFSVSAPLLVELVENYLKSHTNAAIGGRPPGVTRGHHRVPMSTEVAEALERLRARKGAEGSDLERKVKRQFAKAFDLGTPGCDLDDTVIACLPEMVDQAYCLEDVGANPAFEDLRFPGQDHVHRFYDLLPTASGAKVAACRAVVSMPYTRGEEGNRQLLLESSAYAEKIGWTVTAHPEWSWHWPGRTLLFLFQPKQHRGEFESLWSSSFKRWVLENERRLAAVNAPNQQMYGYAIEDVIRDAQLPLSLRNFGVDYIEYLEQRSPALLGRDGDELRAATLFLFNLWRVERGLRPESDQTSELREIERLEYLEYLKTLGIEPS